MNASSEKPFQNFYHGKRVLITGHTGFKGAWMCQWLLDLGAEVAGYSIGIPTQPALFEVLGLEKRITHRFGDIRDLSALNRFFSEFAPDVVFHMAAQSLVRPSYDLPKETFDTNVGGTVNVLECLRSTPSVKAAVIVATDKCYENLESGQAYRETDPLGGKDPYSASKACAEIVFGAYQNSFFSNLPRIHLASARAGNVIGGGDWAIDRLIPDCIRSWEKAAPVEIRSPDSIRPWQHVLEPLSAYLWLACLLAQDEKSAITGKSFNFGPNDASTRSVAEILTELQKTWEVARWNIADSKDPHKKEATLLNLNCERAKNLLGWEASLRFDEMVRMTAQWYSEYQVSPDQAVALTIRQITHYVERARDKKLSWSRA